MASYWDRDDDDEAVLLREATEEERDNKYVVLKSIMEYGGSELQYASPRLKDDEKVVLEALYSSYRRSKDHGLPMIWKYAGPKLKECREKALTTLRNNSTPGNIYKTLPLYLKYDHEITLSAVEREGYLLDVVPPMFRDDIEVVVAAVLNRAYAINYAGPRMQEDKNMWLSLVQKHPRILQYLPPRFNYDKDFVMAVIKAGRHVDRFSLSFLGRPTFKHLLDDDEVAVALVSLDPFLIVDGLVDGFRHLQDRKHLVLAAVTGRHSVSVFGQLDEHHRRDRDVVLAAVSHHGINLHATNLQDDDEVVLAAVRNYGYALRYASGRLSDKREVVLAAVAQSGPALQFASGRLRDEREVVLAAVAQDGTALEFASGRLRDDREVVLAAVAEDGSALQFASPRHQDDREVVLVAVTKYGRALVYASDNLRSDFNVVYTAVRIGDALCYASADLRNNERIVLEAISHYSGQLRDAGISQKRNMNVLTAFPNRCPRSIFKYGVCPDEWGRGTMSLKDYIIDVLRRIDSRGHEHVWVRNLLDPSINPDRRTIASIHDHLHQPAIRLESVMQTRLSSRTDEPAIKRRIVEFSGMELDVQYYNELARCAVFINMAIASGSARFLNSLFQEAYGREVHWNHCSEDEQDEYVTSSEDEQ